MNEQTDVPHNLRAVQDKIQLIARSAARDPTEPILCAVSKTVSAESIEIAIAAGQRVFGENRVQEAEEKWPEIKERHRDVDLHLIGPLQTNKVAKAIHLFDTIETVDRPKLARILANQIAKSGVAPTFYIQVNTGEELHKAGVFPGHADEFIKLCRDEFGLPLSGLMCIPPINDEPTLHFALLREIAHRNGLVGLSMGMSADYDIAIAFGATLVRVGTAIFGSRR